MAANKKGHDMFPERVVTRWKRLRITSILHRAVYVCLCVCVSIVPEAETVGLSTKCFQLRKLSFRHHLYIALT